MKRFFRSTLLAQVGIALGMAITAPSHANVADWEADPRPVRIVVAFPAGGYTDVIGRVMANELGKIIKRNFIVENKVGANGVIGTAAVARSKADGDTLLLAAPGHVTNSLIMSEVPYDPNKDFAPILKVATVPNVLVVTPNSPFKSVRDIIEAAKAQPGLITYASGGIGSSNHLAMELLMKMTGAPLKHIPYKGSSLAETDVAGGHVQMMFSGAGSAVTQIKGGKLRAIAVSSKERISSLPDVPTVAEAGVKGYAFESWLGLFAPANTPKDIVEKLNAAVNTVMQNPEVMSRLKSLGVDKFEPSSVKDFTEFLDQETKQQAALVASFGDIKQ